MDASCSKEPQRPRVYAEQPSSRIGCIPEFTARGELQWPCHLVGCMYFISLFSGVWSPLFAEYRAMLLNTQSCPVLHKTTWLSKALLYHLSMPFQVVLWQLLSDAIDWHPRCLRHCKSSRVHIGTAILVQLRRLKHILGLLWMNSCLMIFEMYCSWWILHSSVYCVCSKNLVVYNSVPGSDTPEPELDLKNQFYSGPVQGSTILMN
jgi:hypothetical protein